MKKITITLENFEGISESQEAHLVGGFSQSFYNKTEASVLATTNNCKGGNCATDCGVNVGCNTVAGCGGGTQ